MCVTQRETRRSPLWRYTAAMLATVCGRLAIEAARATLGLRVHFCRKSAHWSVTPAGLWLVSLEMLRASEGEEEWVVVVKMETSSIRGVRKSNTGRRKAHLAVFCPSRPWAHSGGMTEGSAVWRGNGDIGGRHLFRFTGQGKG